MTQALDCLRAARDNRDAELELVWAQELDKLLDTKTQLFKAFGTFKPLAELDPGLDARLTPDLHRANANGVRYVWKRVKRDA